MFDTKELILSVDEVSKLLKLSRTSCYEAVRRGDIPSIRIGRRILIPRDAFEKMLHEPEIIKSGCSQNLQQGGI
jgi:excisionase family DNA binding protein